MFYEILGIASGVIFIICDIPYLIDTIVAKTKPHRVSWGVAFLLNLIGLANQFASGAKNSLWIFVASVLMTGLIFLASLKNGVGGHTKQDIYTIIACLSGVALWGLFNSPVFSIVINVFIAIFALIPSFAKARRAPETETKIAWTGGTVSAFLATISVGELNWKLLILPTVSVILQGYMVYILYIGAYKFKQKT